MAMTAWAAKFCTNAICLSEKGRTSCRYTMSAPISSSVFEHRNGKESSNTPQFNGSNDVRIASLGVSLIRS